MPAHGVTGLPILDDLSKEVNDGKLSLRYRQSRLARRGTLLNLLPGDLVASSWCRKGKTTGLYRTDVATSLSDSAW